MNDKLRYVRKNKGIKQSQLAEMVGCSQSTIAKYENGHSNLSNATTAFTMKLAKALKCKVEDLFIEEPDTKKLYIISKYDVQSQKEKPCKGDAKERMQANLPYKAWLDGLDEERLENKKRIYEFNNLPPDRFEEKNELIKNILGKTGEHIIVEQPFRCDYGKNIEIGENFFANYNLVILDVGKVKIGDNVQFAPNVAIYTAGHPVHPDSRNSGYEYGIDITIGDNVWLGGNVVVLPGVNIGNNVVVGAGSVVTKDLPDNVIAVGNPCRIIREITEDDRDFYFKDRRFDVDDYK